MFRNIIAYFCYPLGNKILILFQTCICQVLRYVGVVDAINKEGRVELRRYKRDHPFAQLSGSDNIIAFTTKRYKEQALIVRGPGAGAKSQQVESSAIYCGWPHILVPHHSVSISMPFSLVLAFSFWLFEAVALVVLSAG